MNISKDILYKKLSKFIDEQYWQRDKRIVKNLCKTIIYNNPAKNFISKSGKHNRDKLPLDKSMFYTKEGFGMPIGNLTSQVFAGEV